MAYIIGFLIAMFIALTGVGAGTITVPVLVLFLGVPAPVAVGIGLTFSAAVKLILAPAQIARRNVAWRTLGYMLLGGVPGVLVGSLLLKHLVSTGSSNLLNAILGAILVTTASWQIFYSFRPMRQNSATRDRSPWLAWLMFPVGAEVGFSSAGAGALGSAALLSLTPLEPAQVVGTDIVFRLSGFAHRQRRALVHARQQPHAAAATHPGWRGRSHWRNPAEHAHSAPAAALRSLGLAADSGRTVSLQQLSSMGQSQHAQKRGAGGAQPKRPRQHSARMKARPPLGNQAGTAGD